MKIEQLLVQHFYSQKEISLQGMGTFTLSPDFVVPAETDKDINMPENTILFKYDAKATEDDALINYIVQQTRKIKPLASADLDSYLVLGKQFLNIGKPFKIEGLGTLEKVQQGDYVFKQGQFANAKLEAAPVILKEKPDDDHISFAALSKPGKGSKKSVIIALLIIGLLLTGFATWYFLYYKKNTGTPPPENSVRDSTPPITQQVVTVSNSTKADTTNVKLPVTGSKETYTFRVVFKETIDKAMAISKMKDLISRKHKVIMYTADSLYYKLAEPFNLPLSDTTRIKDSLNKFYFKGKAHIELN